MENTDKQPFSINGLLKIITAAFNKPKAPIKPLPSPLLLLGAKLRTGITSSEIASRIISRQSEAGLVVGDSFGDGPNTAEAMLVIMIEEIVNAILTECKVEGAISPGIAVTTIGIGNLGLPVVSKGVTTSLMPFSGILR